MTRVAAIVAAVAAPAAFGALVFALYGVDPVSAYAAMAEGAFGSWPRILEVLTQAAPLVLTGLAVAVPARMNVWNIGGEGQLVCGGIACAGLALFVAPGLPGPVAAAAGLAAGALGGALCALIPAWLRARLQVSEVLSTLMFSYASVIFMEWLYYGPWRDPAGMGFPGTALVPDAYFLWRFPGSRLHLGFLLGIVLGVVFAVLMRRSKWGFRLAVLGLSPKAGRYAGIGGAKNAFIVLLLGGALAGLAGAAEVLGVHHRLQRGLDAGYGFDGVIVACLAGLKPELVPFAAALLAAVIVGCEQAQTSLHAPASIRLVLEGALLLSLLAVRGRFVRQVRKSPANPSRGASAAHHATTTEQS